jgi:hypothetical protein
MKLKFKILVVLLAGLALLYSACKTDKINNPKPVDPVPVDTTKVGTTDTVELEKVVSLQVAANIAQSLSGSYGGLNLGDGLTMPRFATKSNNKVVLTGLVPLCSFFPDTVVSFDTNKGDTLKTHTAGMFKFYFGCDTATVNKVFSYTDLKNYIAYDSLATTGTLAGKTLVYNTIQFFKVKAVDSTHTQLQINGAYSKLLAVDGTMKSFADVTDPLITKNSTSVHAFYSLTGLIIDLSNNGDITAGTATFAASGGTSDSQWYYTGTIKFLGGHKATITINGKSFDVTLPEDHPTPLVGFVRNR